MYRTTLTAVSVGLLITACADRYRDPCGYTRAETATTIRTKNKALGWFPSPTLPTTGQPVYNHQAGSKC